MNLMPPQTIHRTGDYVEQMLGVKQYAEHVGAGERTVRTWLADGRLRSARKLGNVWMIAADDRPADAVQQPAPAGELVTLPADWDVPHMPQAGGRLAGELDAAPVFLELDRAAAILGVSAHAIRSNREYFGVVPFGRNGSLVVPQGVIRRLAGIDA